MNNSTNNTNPINSEESSSSSIKKETGQTSSHHPVNKRKGLQIYLPLLFSVVLIMGMQLGFKMYETLKGKPNMVASSHSVSEIEEVFSYIDARYVDSVSSSTLVENAIVETLKELDPHSNYISAEDLKEINESLQGNFEGIGIEFSLVKDTILVVTPISGGPSEKLGILAGDKIIKIEDSLVAGVNIKSEDIVSKLRGTKGTVVNVSIYRKGVNELLQFPIKRDKIPLFSVDVDYMIDKQVGYIKVNRFSATTYEEFRESLDRLKQAGMRKLILDLRQNPGGYLKAAVNMADEFLDEDKLIVYTKGRKHKRKEYKAQRKGSFEFGDLVILIDEGSASASEILAGAVQDWDRGMVLGRRSFGKGLVQEQYDLSNESALRLTVARYYTPTGRCIQKSYEEGVDNYRKEILERLENGELQGTDSLQEIAVKDSILYKTKIKNRIVYGGGGITPDIFVAMDTSSNEGFLIQARRVMNEFVYDHFSNNQDAYKRFPNPKSFKQGFQVSDDLFGQYKGFLKEKLGFVDESLLSRDKSKLALLIKAQIARQKWQYEGFYPIIHEMDEEFQKAYNTVKEGGEKIEMAEKTP